MGLLDIDNIISSEEDMFLNTLSCESLFKDNYDYIYKYLSEHYTLLSESDLLSDDHMDDYWLIIKKFEEKLSISIYSYDKVIDIGYDVYINNGFWNFDIHNIRPIYDDLYWLNKTNKKFKLYSVDKELFNKLYKIIKSK